MNDIETTANTGFKVQKLPTGPLEQNRIIKEIQDDKMFRNSLLGNRYYFN